MGSPGSYASAKAPPWLAEREKMLIAALRECRHVRATLCMFAWTRNTQAPVDEEPAMVPEPVERDQELDLPSGVSKALDGQNDPLAQGTRQPPEVNLMSMEKLKSQYSSTHIGLKESLLWTQQQS